MRAMVPGSQATTSKLFVFSNSTSAHLELHALIGEEVVLLVLPAWVRDQIRLEIVAEELIFVGPGQRIHEGQDVNLLELWRRVPVREDLRVRRYQA